MADDNNYAEKIIAICLADAKAVPAVRQAVLEEYVLSRELKRIYVEILNYFDTSDGVVPTRPILLDVLRGAYNMDAEGWARSSTASATPPTPMTSATSPSTAASSSWAGRRR